jgi:protein-disulfide isomerase
LCPKYASALHFATHLHDIPGLPWSSRLVLSLRRANWETLMKRLFLCLCLLAAVAPARAQTSSFTPSQRQEIVKVIRDALKSDPSILRDAVEALQADDAARDAADTKARLIDRQKALTANAADPIAGNPTGDVTVVEFYDPRCPYCRRMVPAIEAMLKKDPGIRLVYKDIPVLGAASVTETRAILAAQKQGAYLKMQAALMSTPAEPTPGMLRDTARGLGLDPAKLATDMASHEITEKINQNMSLAHELKVEGTPIFVIGTQMIPGAVDQAALESAVAMARKHG